MILALNYWLHLLATVAWIGGMALLVLVAWPGLDRGAGSDRVTRRTVLEQIDRAFRPVANISLVVLLVTGAIQMDGDPHYEGFLTFTNTWSMSLLAKHIVIILMMIVGALLQFGVAPALDRARMAARRKPELMRQEEEALQQRLRRLTLVNLVLGIVVLMLTAYMTAL